MANKGTLVLQLIKRILLRSGALKTGARKIQGLCVSHAQKAFASQEPLQGVQSAPASSRIHVDKKIATENQVKRFLAGKKERVQQVRLSKADPGADFLLQFPAAARGLEVALP